MKNKLLTLEKEEIIKIIFFEQDEKNEICSSYPNSGPIPDHQLCPGTSEK